MRDEWISRSVAAPTTTTGYSDNVLQHSNISNNDRSSSSDGSGYITDSRPASQGLTRNTASGGPGGNRHSSGLDRGATLNLAARAMKLRLGTKGLDGRLRQREVSERRQVGDAEGVVNPQDGGGEKGKTPWWKNVTMEEGT